MSARDPDAVLDKRFSEPGAEPIPWFEGASLLEQAEIYWLTTARADGRPHVTPLIGIWLEGSMYFSTGPSEQKHRNLEHDPRCIMTTGSNEIGSGVDIVLEGRAERENDPAVLRRLADAYKVKYGWNFETADGGLRGDGGLAHVFRINAEKALAFSKGQPFSQTRWRF